MRTRLGVAVLLGEPRSRVSSTSTTFTWAQVQDPKARMRTWKGWQFCSETGIPGYAARTWAKTSGEVILQARRPRLSLFQAGVTLVKVQGVGSTRSAGQSAENQPVVGSRMRV